MQAEPATAGANVSIRPLQSTDHPSVEALDRALSEVSRRGFFAKRWQAMARHPQEFAALGAYHDERLCGFALAHLLRGEFGGDAPVAVLDALGVDTGEQAHGAGRELIRALVTELRAQGVQELRTQVAWEQSGLLAFFARAGFLPAPRLVLERAVDETDF